MNGIRVWAWEAEILIPNLPNELSILCLARVPRQHHRTLSAVSKPIRSAVSSPEFFEIRSRLGLAEDVLYLRARSPFHLSDMWFAFHGDHRVPLPPPPVGRRIGCATAALGGKIYLCGGHPSDRAGESESEVWVLDCRSDSWSRGPDMVARRRHAVSAVVGGRIYVLGGASKGGGGGGGPYAEVFSGERWEALPEPPVELKSSTYGVTVDGGVIRVWLYLVELKFDTAAGSWAAVGDEYCRGMWHTTLTVVGGVLYGCDGPWICRLEEHSGEWKRVAEWGPKDSWVGPKIVNLDGQLVVMCGSGARFRDRLLEPSVRKLMSFLDPEADKKLVYQGWCTRIDVSGSNPPPRQLFSLLPPPTDFPLETVGRCRDKFMRDWYLCKVSL